MPLARVRYTTLLVLHELLTHQDTEVHGYAVVQATRLAPGSVYPILNRLEKHGWITSRREDPAQRRGAVPRRYYRFVEEHRAEAAQLLADRMGLARKATAHARPPAQ